jgi:hypothetical protein
MKRAGVLLAILLIFLVGCSAQVEEPADAPEPQEPAEGPFVDYEIKTTDDGTKYIVNPDEIRSGGPRKGGIGVDRGIPALAEDNINFVSVEEADEWIADNELVGVLTYDGVTRI